MTIKKTKSGWLVDIQPGGRGGKRYRKTLKTQAEAKAYEAWLTAKVAQAPEWVPAPRDSRRLSELIELWNLHHGMQLRHTRTYPTLQRVCVALGDPLATAFSADDFASYRASRIAEGVTANTVNREHAYLRAVFNELARLGHWQGANPLARLRQFRIAERELSFLTSDQIDALLVALSRRKRRDALLITKLCLATGARWSEAECLRAQQLRGNAVHFTQTKTDKNRSVPIDPALAEEILAFRASKSEVIGDRIFENSAGAFRMGVRDACIELPEGQLTHVLRHTFASHFMMNGGNILTLQRILGHSSLQMTMRYSHLAPDHLKEATRLNPLVSLSNRESAWTPNSTTHQNTDGFETRDVTQLERSDQVNEHCEHAPVRADVSADGPAHTG
ncbi:tyrosine-type recombinase/integrase [Paraburkholderia sp. NMBU_R16]|uniref:phage integrase n=1 Tax=Paraburkholderia sp. NMBU_R16 TaxID=2698676 RepID=UPI0015637E97|nr:tyrosine-type recombinase/integrase [Paraburkholderia sp. NMBU_R16]NRO99502.1 tyrosine-type recombinase/integrase [Paraburkholderia sp. NMBU_R16]